MDRYQALTRMCLNNWHYISRKVLSFHPDINFFTGHSGSGKSTVLDAMQLVLYADTNGRNFFNKAAKEDSDRNLIEYLRGMKNVQENGAASYLRNKNFSSTIVLEFQDTESGECQSIGVVFDVDTSTNDINRLFFRHKGRLLEDHYRTEERVMTSSEVRDYLKATFSKDEVFYARTNEAFRSRLYDDFLGGLEEKKFISLFKRAIPFKMDMKLEEFVKEYICTEQDIHIENMQESVTQYIRLKRRLEEVKEEIAALERETNQYQAYHEIYEKKGQLAYNLQRMEIRHLTEEVQISGERQSQEKAREEEAAKELERLAEELIRLQKERDEVFLAIENSGYAHLERELVSTQDKLARQKRSESLWEQTRNGLEGWEDQLAFDNPAREALEACREDRASEADIRLLQSRMEEVRQRTENRRFSARRQLDDLERDSRLKRQEVESLRAGKKVYPSYLTEARDLLTSKLEVLSGESVQVDILADIIEVENETWRNAVEGYMGNNKLSLMVPPEYAKAALVIYHGLDPERFHRVAVVDTERVMQHVQEQKESGRYPVNALSEEVSTNVEYARDYIDYLMGRVIKCSSVEELRQNKIGITADCVLYQGYKLQHINPRNYREQAYIGSKAMEQKITLLQDQIHQLEMEKQPHTTAVEACDKLLKMEHLSQSADYYVAQMEDIARLADTEAECIRLMERIAEMKTRDLGQLREKQTELERQIRQSESRKDEVIRLQSDAQNKLQKAQEDYLTLNERLLELQEQFAEVAEWEAGWQSFVEEKVQNDSYEHIRSESQKQLQTWEQEEIQLYDKLLAIREEYGRKYSYRGFSMSSKSNTEYESLLHDLTSNKLEDFLQRANDQARIAVDQFKTDFIYKIRDAIRDAIQQKDDLNQVLSKLDFGKDRYHFVIGKSRGEEGKFYDMFMDKDLEVNPGSLGLEVDSQMNLFSMSHENKYGEYMNELLELFIPPEEGDARALEEARKNLERYADYRTYLSFDMEQRVEGMPVMHLSKMLSKNSGGEGQNPLYVALLASFAQNYRITAGTRVRRRPTPRLVVLDEAFSKMDGEKVGSCIGLIRKLGIQAIISATNDKIQNYLDNVDKTFVYANPNKTNISIQEFEKQEFAELQQR